MFLREALCTLVRTKLDLFVRSFVRPKNNHFLSRAFEGVDIASYIRQSELCFWRVLKKLKQKSKMYSDRESLVQCSFTTKHF